MPRLLGDVRGSHIAEPRMGVEASTDGGAADREFVEPGQLPLDRRDPVVELGPPARDLLAEGDRGRVLQVGAADLHEVGVLLLQTEEDIAKQPHRRQQPPVDHLDGGDVHRRRECVVRRLAAVDVVVGVDWLLRAHHATSDLNRPVRDHLVGVHVRLGAAAGLEDHQRKLVVELPGDHLIRRLHDQLHRLGGQLAEFAVGERRTLLEDPEALLDGAAPLETLNADLEVVPRAFRLCPPVAVGGDVHVTHAVRLDAEGGRCGHRRGSGRWDCVGAAL